MNRFKCFLFSLLVLLFGATSMQAQIKIKQSNTSIKKLLQQIEKETEYSFFYSDEFPGLERKISVDIENESIENSLKKIFKNSTIGYKISTNKQIALFERKASSQNTSTSLSDIRKIKGTVVDPQGEPIIGAHVVEIGNPKNGAVSNVNGEFVLSVPNDASIKITYIGYGEKIIKVSDVKNQINVSLQENSQSLSELVVVGYGQQKKVNVVGSISQVEGKSLSQKSNADLTNALTGMMSGVTVIQRSGAPGNPSNNEIQVRGVGSFGANASALVLVDGIPGSLSDINSADVQSISVLKDASTAAIYGARAANGVILVTTKTGQKGKIEVSYSGYAGYNAATAFPEIVPTWEYAQLFNEAANSEVYSKAKIESLKNRKEDVNYLKQVLSRKGFQTGHNININGGSEKSRYLLSFSSLNQNGLVKKNNYSRYTGRINFSTQLRSNLKFTLRGSGILSERNEPAVPAGDDVEDMNGIIMKALRFPGLQEVKTEKGEYSNGQELHGTPPAWVESASFYAYPSFKGRVNVSLDYEPIESLKLTAIGGINVDSYESKRFRSTLILENGRELGPSVLDDKMLRGMYRTFQTTADYNTTLKKHNLSFLLGYSYEDYSDRWVNGFRDHFSSNDLPYLDVGSPDNQKASGSGIEWGLQSLFSRLNYNYDQRYLLEFTMRYDGSSRFPKNQKYGFFPSLALGWRLSEESFIRENDSFAWLSNLKLKASWGVLGNQNIGYYPYQTLYDLGYNYPFGNSLSSGASITTLTDPNLKWESTRTWDLGFESSIFKGMFSFNATYFNRYTYDILYAPTGSISDVLGLKIAPINTGSLVNKGLEIELGYHYHKGDFTFNAQGNLNIIHNEIRTLGVGDVEQLNGLVGSGGLYVGHPMQIYYGYVSDGVFLNEQDIKAWADQTKVTPKAKPGDIRYKDISGPDGVPDGVVDPNYDRVILGSRIPKYSFGLGLNASYKQVDVSVQLQGVAGVKGMLSGFAGFAMWQEGNVQRWQADGRFNPDKPERYPAYPILENIPSSGNPNTEISDFWVRNASYLRVRNLQLGYTLPESTLGLFHLNNARIYVSADNLFTFSSYPKGWDPEINTYGNYYPILKTVTLGLNIKF